VTEVSVAYLLLLDAAFNGFWKVQVTALADNRSALHLYSLLIKKV
jgi:hypothetical protein